MPGISNYKSFLGVPYLREAVTTNTTLSFQPFYFQPIPLLH